MNALTALIACIAIWAAFGVAQAYTGDTFPCTGDVAFLIDQSRGAQDYVQFVFPFLSNLTDYFGVSQSGAHEAFVYFCDSLTTAVVYEFNFQQETERIDRYISTYPSQYEKCAGGLNSRCLDLGLNLTYETIFTTTGSMRTWDKSNYARVLIIVTTGPATDADPDSQLPIIDKLINDDGVRIFAIGIGPNITEAYLQMLTRGNASHSFLVGDFPQLDGMLGDVTAALGTSCSSIPPWAKYCTSDVGQSSSTTGVPTTTGFTTTAPTTKTTAMPTTTVTESFALEVVNDEALTDKLIDLAEKAINATSGTAEDVSISLLSDLANPTGQNLTEYEIYLTALILYEISMAYPVTDSTFDNSIQVIDLVLDQDQRVIRRSNFLYNTTQYIQKSFYQLSAHTTPEFLVHNAVNVFVSVQQVRCDSYSPSDVIGAVQTDSSNVCVPGQSVANAKTDQKVDAYIELPVEAVCQSQPSGRDASSDFSSTTPPSVYRASSIVYRTGKLFGVEDPSANSTSPGTCDRQSYPQSQYVTTVDLTQIDNVTSGEVPIVSRQLVSGGLLHFGMANTNSSDTSLLRSADRCTYWDGETWSTGGCADAVQAAGGDMKVCQCDHLTDFTIIVDYVQGDPILCDAALSNFGTAITILSMIALSIALILYALKTHHDRLPASWRDTRLVRCLRSIRGREDHWQKKTVAQWLMFSLFVFLLLFSLFADQSNCQLSDLGCQIAAASIYCTILWTFTWMPFVSISILIKYVDPLDARGKHNGVYEWLLSLKLIFPITVGVSILVTICIWFTNPSFYARNDSLYVIQLYPGLILSLPSKSPHDRSLLIELDFCTSSCWIRPIEQFIVPGIVLPLALFIIPDVILTILIIKSTVCKHLTHAPNDRIVNRRNLIPIILAILTVQANLGLPWILQYFTIGLDKSIAIHYVYTFFNGAQGLWIGSIYITLWIKAVILEYRRAKQQRSVQRGAGSLGGETNAAHSKIDGGNKEGQYVDVE